MLEKIRRGETISNLPKCLESYQDLCLRLRGIGHVPTEVEESVHWKVLCNKHGIAVWEIKRLETMVTTHEDSIDHFKRLERIRKKHAHMPSTPTLVGRPRTEPSISQKKKEKGKGTYKVTSTSQGSYDRR